LDQVHRVKNDWLLLLSCQWTNLVLIGWGQGDVISTILCFQLMVITRDWRKLTFVKWKRIIWIFLILLGQIAIIIIRGISFRKALVLSKTEVAWRLLVDKLLQWQIIDLWLLFLLESYRLNLLNLQIPIIILGHVLSFEALLAL
jgi:hypothetical protein